MKVSLAYTDQQKQLWLKLEVEEEATVEELIQQSGILEMVPSIDLEAQKVGVFGKAVKLNRKLSEGERVEIYRPIIATPDDDDE